tara:strand:- start:1116 stop:1454 length:339 start_codon:yes stop_codon:yes gene_type:complete
MTKAKVKTKAKAKAKAKTVIEKPKAQEVSDTEHAISEVRSLADSKQAKIGQIVLHEKGGSIQVCKLDKTIILGELILPSPTRDLQLRVEDTVLQDLISWGSDYPVLKRLSES